MEQIIDDCQTAGSELHLAGIANSDFFGAGGYRLNQRLRKALKAGMTAKVIFLDPASRNAFRRSIFELKRLNTVHEITACLETAKNIRKEFPGQLRIRIAPEMPCFLCFNHNEVFCHPYYTSVSGHEMPISVSAVEARERATEHFAHLWGERWILFDLGNVLVPFNHKRVSRELLKFLPKGRQPKVSAAQIHSFIFESHDGPSRNSELDRGKQSLAWLGTQLRDQFGITIVDDDLRELWCSVFDPLDVNAMSCLSKAQDLERLTKRRVYRVSASVACPG